MKINEIVKDGVDELARGLPPRPDLADHALRQARRRTRAVRLAVASGATLAVAGVTAISGIDFTEPAGSGAPELGPASDNPPTDAVSISLNDLSAGESPAVPWFADGALHVGDSQVPLDVDVHALGRLQRVAGGFLATVTPPEAADGSHEHPLYFVSDGGESTALADAWVPGGARTSADGSLIAWAAGDWDAEFAGRGTNTTLVVADAATGDVLHERPASLGPDTSVVGFLDDNRILVTAANNSDEGVYVWDLAADRVDPWMDRYDGATALTSSGDIGAFVSSDDGTLTTAVVDIATEKVLWRTTNRLRANAFSPDGQYAAFLVTPSADELREQEMLVEAGGDLPTTDGRLDLVVVDAQTGEEVVRFEAEHPERLAWEPNGALVFEAWQDSSQMALVRCSLDGDCELATEPRSADALPDASQPPYHLGDNY
ncbi:MAG TPA: hypothetical protein VFZ85_12565 [Jiangellaceae bacterium]